ncbi:MAG: hypothetical protein V4697_03930 [Patescibacteria group bacterium]
MILLIIQIFVVMAVALVSAIFHHDYFTAAFIVLAGVLFNVYFKNYY